MRIPNEDKPHFSVSQLICYLQCPLQYHLQYELGVVWEKTPSSVLFGEAIHKGIEIINKHLMKSKIDDDTIILAKTEYTLSWNEKTKKDEVLWKEDSSELYQKGVRLLELYLEQVQNERPTEVELPFRLPLIDPKTGLFIQDYDFVGKIDAIFTDDTIVEVKTTSKSPLQQEIDQNTQLTFYSWAYRMLYGKPERMIKVINLVKTREPKVVIVETQRTEGQHSWLLATTFQVLRAIGGVAKLWEWCVNSQAGIFPFLLRKSNEGGGGDIDKDYQTAGRWAGDRVVLIGDYDESKLWDRLEGEYTDISRQLVKDYNDFVQIGEAKLKYSPPQKVGN